MDIHFHRWTIYSQMFMLFIPEPLHYVVFDNILISKTINYPVKTKFYDKSVMYQVDLTSLVLL